ncbi:similar to Saccharomyces cerevisiae YFL034W Putative integral membrane protein that interacts with Rpp0p, which is a component of the ribosomal stalk [Maudiozyma barnettii]|uniref:Similar to Saccharomyces cerevisiae YFL034W Putative integral membrane protein that interacts with Rpp0p, which is a component of the ribosomal stalk n=1 Tax=Maudiozyma barnettii TaxID=61262 RepID=A0A8H2VBZ6_9SACH|nr:Mil1p [Kazachstania barnettii]CAB4252478.1 similar to Saccharomyces cerevisiae YFL034W Putative integral membrane protein that interacts with Rpp0p, which is a component of the ribosomal stalk [Kazachstania barnettii]CAD1779213.1 similar to Saccharomyces cerevisiae YFL034W Putative integral membrane protein that interacts with Rpp0p, which is a component of the ribosomal stalk [Kazachstania barnettii]
MSSKDLGGRIRDSYNNYVDDDDEDLGLQLKGLKITKRSNPETIINMQTDTDNEYLQASHVLNDDEFDLGGSYSQPVVDVNPFNDTNEIKSSTDNMTSDTNDTDNIINNNTANVLTDSIPKILGREPDIILHDQENNNVFGSSEDDVLEIRYNSGAETDSDHDLGYDPTKGQIANTSTNFMEDKADNDNNHNNNSDSDSDSDWDTVPAVASYDIYNDKGELQLKPYNEEEDRKPRQQNISSTGLPNDKQQPDPNIGTQSNANTFQYTKIAVEAQAQRSYKTNKKTDFLFEHKKLLKMKNGSSNLSSNSINASTDSLIRSKSNSLGIYSSNNNSKADDNDDDYYDEYEDDIEPADDLNREAQLSITRLLLDDVEKFAYLGAVNVIANQMCTELATMCLCIEIKSHKKLAQRLQFTQKDMAAWKTATLTRLYNHLDVLDEEVEMIEKLSLHKIQVSDLLKCLKTTQDMDNPWENKEEQKRDCKDSTEEQDNDIIDDAKNVKDSADVDITSLATEQTADDITNDTKKDSIVVASEPTQVINPDAIKDKNKLKVDVAWTVICDLFLVLLQNSSYDARSRTLLIRFAEALDISNLEICEFEKRVTDSLDMEQATEDQVWNEEKFMKDRRTKKRRKKMAYVGLAMVGGSLVLGLSGGLLAPVIGAGLAAGLTTVGITGASGFLTGVGGTAVVAVSSTAIGANIGARGMNKRMGSVRTFEFKPLHNNRRVNLILSVSGWIMGKQDDVRLPFSTVDPVEGDLYSLYWEPEMLASMGQTIGIVASEVFTQTLQQVLGATILAGLMTAIQWPMALSKLGYIIDNPWNVSLDRAWNAGLILADTLRSRNLGERPVTLVGFSLGAAVIHSCLVELCKKKALGLVEDVFLFGTPVVRKKEELVMARSVVSGRFVSGYSSKDWVLAYLFRATAGGFMAIMGISPIEDVEGIENFDCTELVDGHMAYRQNMPKLLKKLGIAVLSDEFVEIEEAMDPEEARRHRKLVRDVDAAQKKLSSKKKHSSWMPSWIKPKKSKWREMMEEAVEDKDINEEDVENATTPPNSIPKKKDAAIVDHGALMYEFQLLKAAMRKKEEESDAQEAGKESEDLGIDKSQSLPHTPINRSTNNFQLLSAGRTVLPEDDEDEDINKKGMTFEFPDDV